MASFPGWLKISGTSMENGSLVVNFSVRKWHPYFWYLWVVTLFKVVTNRV